MGSPMLWPEGILRYPHSGKLTSQAGKRIMSYINVYLYIQINVYIYIYIFAPMIYEYI